LKLIVIEDRFNKFFTPRYSKQRNQTLIRHEFTKMKNSFKQEWNEEILLSRYDAIHMSNKDLKIDELAVESQSLSQKASSIFNSNFFKPHNPTNPKLSITSSTHGGPNFTISASLNLTQPKFSIQKTLPHLPSPSQNKTRSSLKHMIKAATSRYVPT
jgi:hypothetical protein